jgi:hypothetical protein
MAGGLNFSHYAEGAIAWYDDGEEGATVGQECSDSVVELQARLAKERERETQEYLRVEIAALSHATEAGADYFEIDRTKGEIRAMSTSRQKELLRVCKAAAKAPGAMPEWAVKATAAGWKPPKGWKP